ncbi:unnamed protein product, partial [marine sediment metagenome]
MKIKTYTPADHYIKALIYGASGSGKTTFGGSAIAKDNSKVLFLSAEKGLMSIKDKKPKYVEIKSMSDLIEAYTYLNIEDHKFETVVIDSITEISNILKLEIEKREGHTMQLQNWGEIKNKLIGVFRDFRDLPMNVIFLSQEAYITDEDKIRKIVPSLDGKGATTAIPRYCDTVGYIKVDIKGNREIFTDHNIKYVTKDRHNCIDGLLEFTDWIKAIKKTKLEKEEIEEVEVETTIETRSDAIDYKNLLH